MANTVTSRTIFDSVRETQILVYILGDGSGELTDQVIVDVSTLTPAPSKVTITDIQYTLIGFNAILEFDATTDVPFAVLSGDTGTNHICYSFVNGLKDNSGSGTTGDIVMTTTSLGSGDKGTILIKIRKD